MANRTIEVFIEKANDGTYWGTSQNFEGVVTTFGNSLEELLANFEEVFADHLEVAKELEEDYVDSYENVSFAFKMDLSSFFNLVPELKISSIAKKANMNESLVRQYKNGITAASQEQARKIQDAVHELGRELLAVKF